MKKILIFIVILAILTVAGMTAYKYYNQKSLPQDPPQTESSEGGTLYPTTPPDVKGPTSLPE